MIDSSGQYVPGNYSRPGALYMDGGIAFNTMPYYRAGYPTSVFTVEYADGQYPYRMCAARGAPDPVRSFGPTCLSAGNPINLGVEVKTQSEPDYSHSGILRFVRTYNSGAGTTYYTGVLGNGWQHNLAVHVSGSATSCHR